MAAQIGQTPDSRFYKFDKTIIRNSRLTPSGSIEVYSIPLSEIKYFINRKVMTYVDGAKSTVYPRYTEKKNSYPLRSYAALIIALSAETIDDGKGPRNTIKKLIQENMEVRLYNDVFTNIVKKYRYNRDELDNILSEYKLMYQMEDSFGMKEDFIRQLKKLTIPMVQKIEKDSWIIFAAEPSTIIYDMLTSIDVYEPIPIDNEDDFIQSTLQEAKDNYGVRSHISDDNWNAMSDKQKLALLPKTQHVPHQGPSGRIEIVRVEKIDNENVSFLCYLHKNEVARQENPELKMLLRGLL